MTLRSLASRGVPNNSFSYAGSIENTDNKQMGRVQDPPHQFKNRDESRLPLDFIQILRHILSKIQTVEFFSSGELHAEVG